MQVDRIRPRPHPPLDRTSLAETEHGKQIVDLLRRNRALAVRVLATADGGRAVAALLDPITTDDVLAHRFTADDAAGVRRLMRVIERLGRDDVAEIRDVIEELVKRAA